MLLNPSPSASNYSIIAINYYYLIVSPNYLATLFKSCNDILPFPYSSNSLNAFNVSYIGSFSLYFFFIIDK